MLPLSPAAQSNSDQDASTYGAPQTFNTDSVLMTAAATQPASYCMNVDNQWYANAAGSMAGWLRHCVYLVSSLLVCVG